MIITKKTKIIATVGPASEHEKILEKLISLGVDGARLNFSHGSHQEHGNRIKLIRNIEKKLNRHVAIIADIQGPKIRIGNLPDNGIELKTGQEITIDSGTREFYENRIPLPSLLFRDGTKEGHLVFLDDGTIQIKITTKRAGIFKAIVLKGGILFSKKGVNVPSLEITSSILNAKDKADIQFAVKADVDYIALSFLRNAEDLKEAKRFLGKTKVKIIAKIERPEALTNIEEIIDEADAVMIARGDLGIETPLWELPVRQKEIIELVRKKMKPVIVATQMLDSMIRNPIPTRAEVSDVANAVFDSTDTVMLSGESANGKYPVEAVDMMRKILEATDEKQEPIHEEFQKNFTASEALSIARSAVHIAEESKAKAIIVEDTDGNTAKIISHFRPTTQIFAVTKDLKIAKRLALIWGITPLFIKNKKLIEQAKKDLGNEGILKQGDKVVCVYNSSSGKSKSTNSITTEII
jgi:pyruvate kinase